MKRILLIALFTVGFLDVTQHRAFAQNESQIDQLPDFSCRVQVLVSAPLSIQSRIEGGIKRELLSLGDVVITGSSPHVQILLRAIDITTVVGPGALPEDRKTDLVFALSTTILYPLSQYVHECRTMSNIDPDSQERSLAPTDITGFSVYYNQWLVYMGRDRIEEVCKEIVTEIDTANIEPKRKQWQEMLDFFNTIETQLQKEK